jgi:autotransporter passenger strand-loop-strand repeat protein
VVSTGGSAVSTTIFNFGVEEVRSGGSASFTTVSSGGTEDVYASGTVSSTTVSSGGIEDVLSGGIASATAVSSGGIQNVDPSTTVVSTTVTNGGVEFVFASPASGGTTTGTVVSSGGAEFLSSGASASGTVLSNGGYLVLLPHATDTGVVSSGGEVVSTGVVAYHPGSGITYYGATANDVFLSTSFAEETGPSAAEYILSGGTATSTTVSRDSFDYVYSSGTAVSTTLISAGTEDVYTGGHASFTTISTGSTEFVFSGGTATSATVKVGGDQRVAGTADHTTVSSGGHQDIISATAYFTTVSDGGYEDADIGGVASSSLVDDGGYEVISAFGSATSTTVELGGAIDVTSLTYVDGGTANILPGDVLSVTEGSNHYTQQLVGDYTDEYFHISVDPLTGSGTLLTLEGTPCYCRGTLILTDRGEIAVEDLCIGDRLVTLSGAARPLRWIGRRSYAGRFAANNRDVLPVLIRRNALADGLPRRDLFVSPLHAMYLDDVLIPASALVNGSSIVQAEAVDTVDYFHLELETHDIIVAEGAASETFVDDDSRGMFHNVAEYRLLYPDAPRVPARFCAPRVEDGEVLEAVRRRLADRALRLADRANPAAADDAAASPGKLRSFLDRVKRDRIMGWACHEGAPDHRVRLRVLDNDVVIGEVVADRYRADLARRGTDDGCHGFELRIPGGLSPQIRHVIRVQCAATGQDLRNSPWMLDAMPIVLATPAAGDKSASTLRGTLDVATRERIHGWAQDTAEPDGSVALQILDNGTPIARVLANAARADLAEAGIGDGRHSFDVMIPGGLSPLARHVIQVRSEASGAEITGSPAVIEAAVGLDADLRQAIARAVAAAGPEDDQNRMLSFLLEQADRLLQQRADAEGGRTERLAYRQFRRRWGPSADAPLAGPSPVEAPSAQASLAGASAGETGVASAGASSAGAPSAGAPSAGASSARAPSAVAASGKASSAKAGTASADPGMRALVIDERLPVADRDAGSQAILSHMRALQRLGYEVSLVAADEMAHAELDSLAGVTCCGQPFYASAEDVLRRQADCFDLVYLHRASIATRYLSLARRYLPRARILYSVADLHHVRLERQAATEERPELLAASRRKRLEECVAAWSADAVITHSAMEVALLRKAVPEASVYRVPWEVPERASASQFATRRGIAFVGGYGHAPNVDGARWLVEAVMPLVRQADPTIECLLVGSEMPESVRGLARPGVVPLGHVADLGSMFDKVRLTAAPLRYGAGVKGKVLESLATGVPCIMTPVAAEGLPLPADLRALVTQDPAEFAAHICRLHRDETAYRAAAAAGLALIREEHTATAVTEALRAAIEGRGPARQPAEVGEKIATAA